MKSTLAAAATATAIALIACASSVFAQDEPLKIKEPPSKHALAAPVSADGNGRYVFGQINDFRADRFLLDTKTGRLWQLVATKEGDEVLQAVPYSEGEGKYSARAPQ